MRTSALTTSWTSSVIGRGDSDELLEVGERFLIRVSLKAVDTGSNPLTKYTTFTLEFSPDSGAALVIERTIPAIVDTVMNLR